MRGNENPFPGMNPYLEGSWSDMHTMLIVYIADALSPALPPDLAARAHERITAATDEDTCARQGDGAPFEEWREGFPPRWTPEGSGDAVAVDEPLVFIDDSDNERWVEIRNAHGRLITVIEVLSPVNKRQGWAEYRERQRQFLSAGVALVEIDLLRGGLNTVAIAPDQLPEAEGTRYLVCVARPRPTVRRREVYPSPLRQRLPTIRVPLRAGDPDVPLAIQPLVDRCYRTGRHWLTAYTRPLDPSLPPEEAEWVNARLQAAGLA